MSLTTTDFPVTTLIIEWRGGREAEGGGREQGWWERKREGGRRVKYQVDVLHDGTMFGYSRQDLYNLNQ